MVTRAGFDGQATAFLSSADVASLGNFQFPPITATVSLNAHSPLTNDVLTATATKSDADGDPVSLTYVWKVNGTVQRTFTSATALSDTFDLSVAGNGSRGDTVTVEVTPSDGTLTGTTVTDTATVADARPTAAIVLNTHSPLTNDVLTATATKSDADGDPVSLTYVWKVNGTVQRTFTSATALSDTFDLSLAGDGSRGDTVTVEVTPSDGTLTGTTVTDTATIANTRPTAAIVLNTHSPLTNDVLTATATKSDADGDAVTLTYVWKVNGTVQRTFTSATALSDTFDLSLAGSESHGDTVTVEVTPSDGTLTGTTVTDTATVADTRPTAAIVLNTHSPLTNDVLTATATKSDADGDPVSLTYVWKVNGTVQRTFTSATALSDTFDLSLAGNGSRGDTVTVEVTPSDGTLTGTTVTDTATIADTRPTAAIVLNTHSPLTNDVLTATATKSDADGDPVSLTYVWKVNGTVQRTFTSATALSDTFDLSLAGNGSRGDTVTVEVTPSDGTLTGTTVNDTTTAIDATPSASVTTPSSPQSGAVTIGYSLTDANADLCDINVQYTTDGGTTWNTASPASGGDGTMALASSPGGTTHTYVWASDDNLVSTSHSNVRIRITPISTVVGTAGTSGVFTVDNSAVRTIPSSTIGLYSPTTSVCYLRNTNDVGFANQTFSYGPADAGWLPIAGDWNGDGTDSVGLYNPATSVFYLRNANTIGYADLTFAYGMANAGWLPIAGDWDGDGTDSVGLYDPATSVFYLRNTNTTGYADLTFTYGMANVGWLPIAGDWNSDGSDTIGLYSPTTAVFYLRNTNTAGFADLTFAYGVANAGWKPIVGDWNANGTDTIGLYSPTTSTFYLRDSNDAGFADSTFAYGPANAGWTPIVGGWHGSSGSALRAAACSVPDATVNPPLRAVDPRAVDQIDLPTLVALELGQVAGSDNPDALASDLMSSRLPRAI